jgi:hypothetical protein
MTQQWRNGGGEKANLMSDALFAKSANHCVFILLIFISKSLVNSLFQQTVFDGILKNCNCTYFPLCGFLHRQTTANISEGLIHHKGKNIIQNTNMIFMVINLTS